MSSKKVVKKKAQDVTPPNGGTVPGKPVGETDARVVQQMRVLEVVKPGGRGAETDNKKYSPRTENHVKQLTEILDQFGMSRSDIAAMVRRCNHDDVQIQNAVANIIEDRDHSEPVEWGTVKNKKQVKEEKKIKEEEEKKEQDRLDRETEKQRKEAEKRAAKEHARQMYLAREAAAGQNWKSGQNGADAGSHVAALPPDPAIIFASGAPVGGGGAEKADDDEWWDGNGGNADWGGEWETKGSGRNNAKGSDKNWEDWKWEKGQWDKDGDWGGSKGDDSWWQGDWDKAGNDAKEGGTGGGRGRRSKEAKGGGAAKTQKPEKEDAMWDMPDANAGVEGGLDQWSMGDIRLHERRVAASESAAEGTPVEGMMRTVEEIEREQFGATAPTGNGRGAPPSGKSCIENLLQPLQPANEAASTPDRVERGGKKGKGEGKTSEGKGKGRGDRSGEKAAADQEKAGGEAREARERRGRSEKGKEGESGDGGDGKVPFERLDRSDDPRRQAVEEVGDNVTVRKHSSMGCAVISLREPAVREAILRAGNETIINNIRVQMKPHKDKDTNVEVPTDIFVAWGRQVEKTTPLSERELVKHFDVKHQEFTEAWKAEAEEKARQQKLVEDQQRQQAEQRQREEERQRFEADLARRRVEEEQQQRKMMEAQLQQTQQQAAQVQEQRRKEEQMRLQRENQAKWINGLQGNWAAHGLSGAASAQAAGAAGTATATRTGAATGAAGAAAGAGAATGAAAASGGAAAQAPAQQQQQAHADPAAAAQAQAAASAAGLNAAAAAYPQQWTQAQQWMQAMYAQQGWQQQQMAAAAAAAQQQQAQQQQQQQQQQRNMAGAMHAQAQQQQQQDYESQLRAQAQAYYAYMEQQRGSAVAAAYAQQQAQQAQSGQYPQNAAFGYGAAAAAYSRGERI